MRQCLISISVSAVIHSIENDTDNDNEIIEKIKNVDIQDILMHLNENYYLKNKINDKNIIEEINLKQISSKTFLNIK